MSDTICPRLLVALNDVVEHPEKYKLSECCDLIFYKETPFCTCYGYRFEEDMETVRGRARQWLVDLRAEPLQETNL